MVGTTTCSIGSHEGQDTSNLRLRLPGKAKPSGRPFGMTGSDGLGGGPGGREATTLAALAACLGRV